MANYLSLQAAIVNVLRTSGVYGIDWGERASPYYEEAQEPQPKFPYVTLEFDDPKAEHTFGKGYTEEYLFRVYVLAEEADVVRLTSPYAPGSVLYYLDSYMETPEALNGSLYTCTGFTRQSWNVKNTDVAARGPKGGRVWTGYGVYAALLNVPYHGR